MCLFWLGPAVASPAARPCMHFWKRFEPVSPEGCCCLGVAQAIKASGSSASAGPHAMAPSPLAAPYRELCCHCWAMHPQCKLPKLPLFLGNFKLHQPSLRIPSASPSPSLSPRDMLSADGRNMLVSPARPCRVL